MKTALENPVLRAGFASLAWRTPHTQEKCSVKPKVRSDPKVAELTDLYWDDNPLESSLSRPANLAVPDLR